MARLRVETKLGLVLALAAIACRDVPEHEDTGTAATATAPATTPVAADPAAVASPAPPEPPTAPARCAPEPPLEEVERPKLTDAELARMFRNDPKRLGSASIGAPTGGALWGGVELKNSASIAREGGHAWGTAFVVASLERAVREVRRCFPDTPRLSIGDISRREGGWLKPHRSHQSGLDVDVGYYYRAGPAWYVPATAETLDVARTWALVRALVEGGNVEYIFMDRSVIALLSAHAEALPAEKHLVADIFESKTKRDGVVRHTRGHQAHFHVRFRDPASVAMGARIKRVVAGSKRAPRLAGNRNER